MIAKTTLAGIRTTLRIHVKEGCVKVADLPTCTAHRQRYSMGDRKKNLGIFMALKSLVILFFECRMMMMRLHTVSKLHFLSQKSILFLTW